MTSPPTQTAPPDEPVVPAVPATPAERSRRLRTLGHALDRHITRLQREYLAGAPAPRAALAELRRAVGHPAGSVPTVWPLTIGIVPESLGWDRPEPSRAEQAAHAAMTLYAVHQQSLIGPAHVPTVSFGRAASLLRISERWSEEAVSRRFMAMATAESISEVLVHARGIISQLRVLNQGLDYACFADDLHRLLTPGHKAAVRLQWGRDFYRSNPASDSSDASTSTTNEE